MHARHPGRVTSGVDMASRFNPYLEREHFRLWGTREEPIKGAVRALNGHGQKLALRLNRGAPKHQLVRVETLSGALIGYIPRPDAERLASRIELGDSAQATLVKWSDARVRPVPVIEVVFVTECPVKAEGTRTQHATAPLIDAPQPSRSSICSRDAPRGCAMCFAASVLLAIGLGALSLSMMMR